MALTPVFAFPLSFTWRRSTQLASPNTWMQSQPLRPTWPFTQRCTTLGVSCGLNVLLRLRHTRLELDATRQRSSRCSADKRGATRTHGLRGAIFVKKCSPCHPERGEPHVSLAVEKESQALQTTFPSKMDMDGIWKEFVRCLFVCLEAEWPSRALRDGTFTAHRAETAMAEAS